MGENWEVDDFKVHWNRINIPVNEHKRLYLESDNCFVQGNGYRDIHYYLKIATKKFYFSQHIEGKNRQSRKRDLSLLREAAQWQGYTENSSW